MKVNGIPYRSLWPTADGAVEIIDQRSLPHAFATRVLRSVDDVIDAIRTMAVRGAPLIGVAGAYGLALAMQRDAGDAHLADAHRRLNASRPTAVNLRWALDRLRAVLAPLPPAQRPEAAWHEAARIADEDVELNRAIGAHGARLIAAVHARTRRTGAGADPLQRRLDRDGRLRHRAVGDLPGARRRRSRCTSGSTRRGRAARGC